MTRRPTKPAKHTKVPPRRSQKPRARSALALAAVGSLALAAYAYHHLESIPQAGRLGPGFELRSAPGQEMRLEGIAPGSSFAFALSGPASASLSFGKGAELAPDPALPSRLPMADGATIRLYAVQKEDVFVDVQSTGGGPGILHVEPSLETDEFLLVSMRAEGAGLRVDLRTNLDPRAQEHSVIRMASGKLPAALPMQEAHLEMPPGVPFQLRVRVADLERLTIVPALIETRRQGFPVRALEIRRGGRGDFERLSLACGSAPNRILWRRPFPAVGAEDCEAGHLEVTGFRLDKGVAASLEGSGFVVSDGRTTVWQGFREFRQNDVVKTALGFLLASLVGWAFVRLRGGGAAPPGRRRTR